MDIMDFSRIDFEYDTHRVCFYLSLRYAFSHPKSSVPSSGTSVIIIVAVLSTIITKNHWVFKVETSSREKMRLPKLLAQVGLGRKRILSQLVQSRPNSVAVHCNRLIVIVIVCLRVIVIVCLSLSHHPQLVVTVSISVTLYDCQCHYFFLFTMSAYIWDSLYERRSVYNFNDFVKHTFLIHFIVITSPSFMNDPPSPAPPWYPWLL